MARARLIKPTFFGDVTLSEVSLGARLLYVGLWGHMDRRGLMEFHPKLVKRDIFPYDDDVTASQIEKWVDELVERGRIRLVIHDNKRFLYCAHLTKHQQFHHKEKVNPLIPEAVYIHFSTNPGPVPEKGTVPTLVEPGADPTDTETEADTEAVLGLRIIRTAANGFLSDVTDKAIKVWCKAYGTELMIKQLAACEAKWVSHEKRNQLGEKPLFINTWFKNALADEKNAARLNPVPTLGERKRV